MADEPQQSPGIFEQCQFAIVRSKALDDDWAQQLLTTIEENGGNAVVVDYNESNVNVTNFTHFISTNIDFPYYEGASNSMIPIIKPTWVAQSIGRRKLANPRQFNPDPRAFMSDVVVCFADLPEGDCDAIIACVTAAGGLHSKRIASMVTHLVALSDDSDKCQLVRSKKLDIKIVLPHWFDDCLKLASRIDERPYLLPDPEILRMPHPNPPPASRGRNVIGASTPDPPEPKSLSLVASPSHRSLDVFEGKNVVLAEDLGISSHLRATLEDIISRNGGWIASDVQKASMFICKYREGLDYKIASRSGKDVGNLAWLYYLITHNTWTSPMRRLLHYPIARSGVPGFSNFRISLSNYSGDARIYLENLITAAGAECTKTLKQDNTHLITAHNRSEKCQAAQEWGIHLINHLWLEESYAQWKTQSVSASRYTHFPPRTNLGEIVGQTRIDRNAVERNFFPPDEDLEMQDIDEGPHDHNQITAPPSADAVPPSSLSHSPHVKAFTNRAAAPRKKASDDDRKIGEVSQPHTPAINRFVGIGKENVTPSTNSSRKSKETATARLHEIAPDIALYEKEKKRVGGVVYGGRKKESEKVPHSRKRSVDELSTADDADIIGGKKAKKSRDAPSMTLLVSGYKKWVGQPKTEDEDREKLRDIGILVTQDPSRASHLAAPSIVRTAKFVTALAFAPIIVSTEFIDACLNRGELVDAEKYLLKDKAGEKKYGVTLTLSRERAQKNKTQLLAGRTIFCVRDIHGGLDTFRGIAAANGAQCNLYEGRPHNMVGSRRSGSEVGEIDDEAQKDAILISSQSDQSIKLWRKFQQMAEGSRKTPRIVKADWLLETAIAQTVLSFDKFEIEGSS